MNYQGEQKDGDDWPWEPWMAMVGGRLDGLVYEIVVLREHLKDLYSKDIETIVDWRYDDQRPYQWRKL